MSKEAFRVFLAVVLVAVLLAGAWIGWHFTHQHQVCGRPTGIYVCRTEFG